MLRLSYQDTLWCHNLRFVFVYGCCCRPSFRLGRSPVLSSRPLSIQVCVCVRIVANVSSKDKHWTTTSVSVRDVYARCLTLPLMLCVYLCACQACRMLSLRSLSILSIQVCARVLHYDAVCVCSMFLSVCACVPVHVPCVCACVCVSGGSCVCVCVCLWSLYVCLRVFV